MIKQIVFVLVLCIMFHNGNFWNSCQTGFCSPFLKRHEDHFDPQPAPIFLGLDKTTGCTCRVLPEKFTICFGKGFTCTDIPKIRFNITTTTLVIENTAIRKLKVKDFTNLEHLKELRIDGNPNLEEIEPGTFMNLFNLVTLSISHNPGLTVLENGTFEGLSNLKKLIVIKNGFLNIANISISLTPIALPNLKILHLSENNFNEIGESDFQPMENSTVDELNLILCGIEFIHPESLTPLNRLSALRLGENHINESTVTNLISTMIENKVPLKVLNLYLFSFRKTPPTNLMNVIGKSNISHLYLARNQFEIIDSKSFPSMPNLELLDLSEIFVQNITSDAFVVMPKLKTLLLNKNKLSYLPKDIMLPNLLQLDLRENSENWKFELLETQFRNMQNLEYLDLQYSKLLVIHDSNFIGAGRLHILGLKNCSIIHIDDYAFSPLNTLVYLDLGNNLFVVHDGIFLRPNLFHGLSKLEVLLLSGNSITHLSSSLGNPFKYLKSLKYLGLENNKILTISSTDLVALKDLKYIDVSRNEISTWTTRVFTNNTKLRYFDGSRNKLGYISDAMYKDFVGLEDLKLDLNPFSCDCKNIDVILQNRIKKDSARLINLLNKTQVFCAYPEEFTNLTISTFLLTEAYGCIKSGLSKFLFVLPIMLLIVVFLVLSMLVYYYRWHIRYWLFLTRLHLSRKGRLKKDYSKHCFSNYVFDAFVSYSTEDQNFVSGLVAMLENYEPFLKLCVYERDFEIGSMLTESVLENIAKSRKTLLIVSNSYAKSYWCVWESQIAGHHKLFFENFEGEYVDDCLIIVRLGPVNESLLTPTLKYLLKTRIYLQWDPEPEQQKHFWDKLRNALAPPKMESLTAENLK